MEVVDLLRPTHLHQGLCVAVPQEPWSSDVLSHNL